MNELELSTNLNEIELEIQWHKENAGRSVWEIGRRLNHVKENDLAHGEFSKWLEAIDISHTQANRFMKIAKELKKPTSVNLGVNALYLIATLPEKEREIEHETADGEIKTPDEMTVRELQELKKQLKEKDTQLEQAKRSEQIAIDKLEQKQNEEPKEVFPHDYEEAKAREQQLSSALKKAQTEADEYKKSYEYEKEQYKKLIEKRANVNEKSEKYDQLTEAIDNAEGRLSNSQKLISDYKDILKIIRGGNEAILKIGGLAFMDISKTVNSSTVVSSEFDSLINSLERLIRDLREVRNQNIIEGDFTNGE